MNEPLRISADLDFSPEVVVVRYDEPWRVLRWSGHRRVRRGFVLRPRVYRELLADQAAFDQIALRLKDDPVGYFIARIIVIAGKHAADLPPEAQKAIDETYRRVNHLSPLGKTASRGDGDQIGFDAVLRRLERAPFNLRREEVMDMTAAQIEARFAEWGEEKLADWRAEHPEAD